MPVITRTTVKGKHSEKMFIGYPLNTNIYYGYSYSFNIS